MKRKMRKFNEGGETKYNREDEGILGGKIKYREDDEGRKFVAGKATPFDRNPSEQRYYSVDDVKSKLSGLFGGKKEDEPKKSTTMPSGYEKLDATEGNARTRQMTDSMTNKPEPAGKTYLREEADIDYKSEKKAAPTVKKSKIEAAAPATKKAKAEEATSSKEVISKPAKAADKKPVGKDATPMKEEDDKPAKYEDGKAKIGSQGSFKFDSKPVARTRAGTIVKSSDEPSALDIAAAKQKGAEKMKKQNRENDATFKRIGDAFSNKSPNRSYKSGGSVKSSASSRGDGIAMRGKTKGKIY